MHKHVTRPRRRRLDVDQKVLFRGLAGAAHGLLILGQGVEVVGRLAGIRDGKAQFSGSLRNVCALADLKMNRLLASIDEWAERSGLAC